MFRVLFNILCSTLKGSWARVKTELPVDAAKRQLLIDLAVHLHNLRARYDLLNQIRTVYAEPGASAISALNRGGIGERQRRFWELDEGLREYDE